MVLQVLKRLFIPLTILSTGLGCVSYLALKSSTSTHDKTSDKSDTTPTIEVSTPPSQNNNVAVQNLQKTETLLLTKGSSLPALLTNFGIDEAQRDTLIQAIEQVLKLSSMHDGKAFQITYQKADEHAVPVVEKFVFSKDQQKRCIVEKNEAGLFEAKLVDRSLTKESQRIGGIIQTSFYGSAKKLAIPRQIINEAAKALSFSVNMQQIKPDQPFELLYEDFRDEDGVSAKVGHLKYISLEMGTKKCTLYRFTDSSGHSSFYNESGEGVERALLMSPLDVKRVRVSSGFGMRTHPILGYSKKHKGIDLAAPSGTRVISAGNGVVTQAGYSGNYGYKVSVRHEGGYQTVYAHLRKIDGNVRVGARVRQGQKLGEVGMTGMATGPHLHHEVIFRGQHINPQAVKKLPSKKLAGTELVAFKKLKNTIENERQTPVTQVA